MLIEGLTSNLLRYVELFACEKMMKRALFLTLLGASAALAPACTSDSHGPGLEMVPEPRQRATRPQSLRTYGEDRRAYATPPGSEDLLILPGEPKGLVAASDATTDTVYIVDIPAQKLLHEVAFAPGTHPGRMATQGDALLVVSRRAGELARVTRDGRITHEVPVCPAPRGVAFDEERERVWVACASGELVWLEPENLQIVETFYVGPDLRDVAIASGHVFVSSFRAAEVLRVDPDSGAILSRRHAPPPNIYDTSGDRINSLWRMIATRDRRGLLLSYHQTSSQELRIGAATGAGYYGSGGVCGRRPIAPVVAKVILDEEGEWGEVDVQCAGPGALPVDVDEDRCGEGFALFASPNIVDQPPAPFRAPVITSPSCAPDLAIDRFDIRLAAAIDALGNPLILSRGDGLHIHFDHPGVRANRITLAADSPTHLGQLLFHGDLGSGMACASCHPEGGDDGNVWTFQRTTLSEDGTRLDQVSFRRRTQNLRAGVEGKLHWDGEFEGMGDLMGEVFSGRMSGFPLIRGDSNAIASWLEQLEPEPGLTPRPDERELVARGELLYAEAGCDGCHGGELLTDFEFHDVGTGGLRKTPTLRGVGQRERLMSDGCAVGLAQRFLCGGDRHGDLSSFEEGDLDALIAYLETL